MLPESLVRRLIRKKISSKYEILKEENLIDQIANAKKKADAKQSQKNKEKKDKLKNIIPGDDTDEDNTTSGKVMPSNLVDEMEDELSGKKVTERIKIYDNYMALSTPEYILPEAHKTKYIKLLQAGEEAGTISFHTKMWQAASRVIEANGMTINLKKFDTLDEAIKNTRDFALQLKKQLNKNDAQFNNTALIKFKGNIKKYPAKYGINDTLGKRRLPERTKLIINDFISAITTKDNLGRLLSDEKLTIDSGFKFQGKPVNLEYYEIGPLFYGDDNNDYHKRLGALIDVLFLPKSSNTWQIASMLGRTKANLSAIKSRDEDDVANLYTDNKELVKKTFDALKVIYDSTRVNANDVKTCYQSWYELMEADSSDLLLCRMMSLLLSAESKTFTDWFSDFQAVDPDLATFDINNPRILFKAVKRSMEKTEGRNAEIGWYEIVGAHLGTMGQSVGGSTDSNAYLENAYETIGLSLYGLWKLNYNKKQVMSFLSPEDSTFPSGDDKGDELKGNYWERMAQQVMDPKLFTKMKAKKIYSDITIGGTGPYYKVINSANKDYEMFFAKRDVAQKSIAQVSKGVYKDAGEKVGASGLDIDTEEKEEKTDPQESKIFRSKDGSKILVEHKDLRKLIKALKNSRRK